jgi:hypothetical protein
VKEKFPLKVVLLKVPIAVPSPQPKLVVPPFKVSTVPEKEYCPE